jgi:DNA-3-methyladenine glycosylase I
MAEKDVERLLGDAGIVRHRRKIESAIQNAKRCLELQQEYGSLATFVWSFEPADADRPDVIDADAVRRLTESAASRALSHALKTRGWSFVGPTTMYAFLQSSGVVNDHVESCAWRTVVEAERARFRRP